MERNFFILNTQISKLLILKIFSLKLLGNLLKRNILLQEKLISGVL